MRTFVSLTVLATVALASQFNEDIDIALETAGDPSTFSSDGIILSNVTDVEGEGGWTLYKQCDSRWANQQLGTCSQTICGAGCAMSSVAMMLKTKGANQNPSSLDKWLTKNGGYVSGCNIVWSKADAFGKTKFQAIETASESAICNGLKAGHGIIANVNGGHHWVLLTGCRGGGVFNVNDPGYNKATYKKGEILREAVYH